MADCFANVGYLVASVLSNENRTMLYAMSLFLRVIRDYQQAVVVSCLWQCSKHLFISENRTDILCLIIMRALRASGNIQLICKVAILPCLIETGVFDRKVV